MQIQSYSKYLKAEDDFKDGEVQEFTITNVRLDTVGTGDEAQKKYILSFAEIERELTLNTTNLNVCLALFGKDDTDWRDKKIKVRREKTSFGGKVVACLRIQVN